MSVICSRTGQGIAYLVNEEWHLSPVPKSIAWGWWAHFDNVSLPFLNRTTEERVKHLCIQHEDQLK